MPNEFKTYLVEASTGDHKRILLAIKRASRDLFPTPLMNWVPFFPYNAEAEFFLKGMQNIFWGRIFYDTLSHADLDKLNESMTRLIQQVKERISLFIFFPSMGKGVQSCLEKLIKDSQSLPSLVKQRFFEYCFLRGQDQQGGLALKELIPTGLPAMAYPSIPIRQNFTLPPSGGHFYKQNRLTRSELTELMELSVALKKADSSKLS